MSWANLVRSAASAETDRVKARVRAAVRSMLLMAVAAVLLLIGVVFVLAGVYGSLSEIMPRWQAGGIIGLAALVLCFVLVLIAKKADGSRGDRARPAGYRTPAPTDPGAEVDAARPEPARKDVLGAYRPSAIDFALAAFVAGLVASRRPRRKRSSGGSG